MAEHESNAWKEWAKMLLPALFAAGATLAVLEWRLGDLEKSFEKQEDALKGVRAEVAAIHTTNARYDERINSLRDALVEVREDSAALRERLQNAETSIRVLQRD